MWTGVFGGGVETDSRRWYTSRRKVRRRLSSSANVSVGFPRTPPPGGAYPSSSQRNISFTVEKNRSSGRGLWAFPP